MILDLNKVWFISDHHFNHKNIVKFTGRPENHDYVMIANHNAIVGKDDLVYDLGDFAFADIKTQQHYFDRLNGTKVLIRGNHDGSISRMEGLGFMVPERYLGSDQNLELQFGTVLLILTHKPMKLSELKERKKYLAKNINVVNVHGHIHNNKMQSEVVENKDDVYIDTHWEHNIFYFNVSVEVLDMKPIRASELINRCKEFAQANNHGIVN
jgi:calcineurin-like phosphoesterase family protein